MLIDQLFEAEIPAWVKKLDSDYKHLLRTCGFEDRTPPKPEKQQDLRGKKKEQPLDTLTMWRFGRLIRPLPGNDMFSKDELMDMGKTALPGEIAKFLIKLAKDNPSRVVRTVRHYQWMVGGRSSDHRIIQPDDNVRVVTQLVAEALRDHRKDDKRWMSQKDYNINDLSFTWEITPPKEFKPEQPQTARKLVRVVRKNTA